MKEGDRVLTQVCDFIHNYFEYSTLDGTFTISEGKLDPDIAIAVGQRFRIRGSKLNDGIYTYHGGGAVYDDDYTTEVVLRDETFKGHIITMAVPRTLIDLALEIRNWVDANKAVLESPYTSESFNGYSYTKAAGAGANGSGTGALTWQDVFRTRLNAYRKIA